MIKHSWIEITQEDVIKAIEKFLADNPEYPEPRSTFLVYDGKKLPAKHIRGMAYYEHYGIPIRKSDFNGGMETVKFFERLGFEMNYFGIAENNTPQKRDLHKSSTAEYNPSPEAVDVNNNIKKAPYINIAMYLQTDEVKNEKAFNRILPVMKNSDADIIVFPEYCYVPFIDELANIDIALIEDQDKIFDACLRFSSEISKAVIVCSSDKYGTIYSVFANSNPLEGETDLNLYIKHTMCQSSCLEFVQYPQLAGYLFDPILFKGYLIGMTICYDCNHALFSRMYGLYGIDLIINSTGGDVVYDKWFKYNKVRAIENDCYTLVTMGGNGINGNNYVFGFDKNGGQLNAVNLCGDSSKHNIPGGLYLYTVSSDEGIPEADDIKQNETINKKQHLKYPVKSSLGFLESVYKLSDNIYHKKVGNSNVFFFMVEGMDIMKPEKIQYLLYSEELKDFTNRKYIIINRHNEIDKKFFIEKLSVVLKVRSMENFCAVILESNNINKCYQCGKNRTAQVVKPLDGFWGIDLERTSGPEAIWKNKRGMRESWRKNYEWLVKNAENLYH